MNKLFYRLIVQMCFYPLRKEKINLLIKHPSTGIYNLHSTNHFTIETKQTKQFKTIQELIGGKLKIKQKKKLFM